MNRNANAALGVVVAAIVEWPGREEGEGRLVPLFCLHVPIFSPLVYFPEDRTNSVLLLGHKTVLKRLLLCHCLTHDDLTFLSLLQQQPHNPSPPSSCPIEAQQCCDLSPFFNDEHHHLHHRLFHLRHDDLQSSRWDHKSIMVQHLPIVVATLQRNAMVFHLGNILMHQKCYQPINLPQLAPS